MRGGSYCSGVIRVAGGERRRETGDVDGELADKAGVTWRTGAVREDRRGGVGGGRDERKTADGLTGMAWRFDDEDAGIILETERERQS